MGGRGAASPSGYYGENGENKYGSEYTSVLQKGNIKFLIPNKGRAKAPLETQINTKQKPNGRIYVTIDGKATVSSISYYDGDGKKFKSTDVNRRDHIEDKENLGHTHTHVGYEHSETGSRSPDVHEQKMVNRVLKIWEEFSEQNPEIIAAIKKRDAAKVRSLLPPKISRRSIK